MRSGEITVGMISDSCDMNGDIARKEWLRISWVFFSTGLVSCKAKGKFVFVLANVLHNKADVMTAYKLTDEQLGNKHT